MQVQPQPRAQHDRSIADSSDVSQSREAFPRTLRRTHHDWSPGIAVAVEDRCDGKSTRARAAGKGGAGPTLPHLHEQVGARADLRTQHNARNTRNARSRLFKRGEKTDLFLFLSFE